jgi:hypothetical protein
VSNLKRVLLCQGSSISCLSSRVPTTIPSIIHVILMCSNIEMLRVHTTSNITTMQHMEPGRNRPYKVSIEPAVRSLYSVSATPNNAIAPVAQPAEPEPAARIRLWRHPIPEVLS